MDALALAFNVAAFASGACAAGVVMQGHAAWLSRELARANRCVRALRCAAAGGARTHVLVEIADDHLMGRHRGERLDPEHADA